VVIQTTPRTGDQVQENDMAYRIECYDGSQHPATYATETDYATTERDARRIAARMLGHASLRGAASWERYQGGTVYQFGPRAEDNGHDYVVIIDESAERDERAAARADYDVEG
jgi:hypothetical protein